MEDELSNSDEENFKLIRYLILWISLMKLYGFGKLSPRMRNLIENKLDKSVVWTYKSINNVLQKCARNVSHWVFANWLQTYHLSAQNGSIFHQPLVEATGLRTIIFIILDFQIKLLTNRDTKLKCRFPFRCPYLYHEFK